MISIYNRLRAEGDSAERVAKLARIPVTTLKDNQIYRRCIR